MNAMDAVKVDEYDNDERFFGIQFCGSSFDQTAAFVSQRKTAPDFAYIVTPNVQHAVLFQKDASFRTAYDRARITVCDSQIIRSVALLFKRELQLVRGSDLTAHLFKNVFEADDNVRVLCSSEELAAALEARFPALNLTFHVPPDNLDVDSPAFETAVKFVADGKDARATFVCIGIPKSELICFHASQHQHALGTALCTGGSLEFLVGRKKRAPKFMQDKGLEWLYRAATEPRRLLKRYAADLPPLLRLIVREFRQRR